MGLPDDSDRKESACHAGDPDMILGAGRSSGEGDNINIININLNSQI